MNARLLLLVGLVLAACTSEPAATPKAAAAHTSKVLVVGWDGVRADSVVKASTPTLDALCAKGACSFAATTQMTAPTVSAPGWTSIFTGVEPMRSGVLSNDMFPFYDPTFPTFLRRVRVAGKQSAAACDWEALCSDFLVPSQSVDVETEGDEEQVTQAMEKQLAGDMDAHFVHLDLPDHAGHTSGFSPDNPDYIAAIEKSDLLTGRLIAAINKRPTRAQEDWLIVVTTDHGGEGTTHGAMNALVRSIFLVVAGDRVQHAELAGASHMDVHPTVLAYLGIAPATDLDGHVVGLLP